MKFELFKGEQQQLPVAPGVVLLLRRRTIEINTVSSFSFF